MNLKSAISSQIASFIAAKTGVLAPQMGVSPMLQVAEDPVRRLREGLNKGLSGGAVRRGGERGLGGARGAWRREP
jgi:hypothetical protein